MRVPLRRRLARLPPPPSLDAAATPDPPATGAEGGLGCSPSPHPEAAAVPAAVVAAANRLVGLRARLERLRAPRPLDPASAPPGAGQVGAPAPRIAAQVMAGAIEDLGPGPVHVLAQRLPASAQYGRIRLADFAGLGGEQLGRLALDADWAEVNLAGALFLDTETTGLAGGTGTVPFLIGVGWFEDGCWHTEQLLLPQLGTERAQLLRLQARLQGATCLVTYNGRSFDWPLLRSRSILLGVPLPGSLPHLDLLHCSRRLLRHRGVRLNLTAVEGLLLARLREDDVAGAAIPALYFAYLRGAALATLAGVLRHNADDLAALAALAVALVALLEGHEPICHPGDALGCAQVHLRGGAAGAARPFLERACAGEHPAVAAAAALLSARESRRAGGAPQAARDVLLQALAVAPGTLVAAPLHLALAKLYEHRLGDPCAALGHARRAPLAEPPQLHERRLRRLHRKLGALGCPAPGGQGSPQGAVT